MKRTFDMRSTIKTATIEMDYEEYINLMWILESYSTSPVKQVWNLPSRKEAELLKNEIENSENKFIWDDEDI